MTTKNIADKIPEIIGNNCREGKLCLLRRITGVFSEKRSVSILIGAAVSNKVGRGFNSESTAR
jgi:hypothetical protein